ncbi:MAG TPA: hypothetical protein VGY13_14860 [Solirubrobacteraceae bacterium]|jgi:hypothetical protein|nr:hypothetical protein [Solirubrobacteraceae bacterium]
MHRKLKLTFVLASACALAGLTAALADGASSHHSVRKTGEAPAAGMPPGGGPGGAGGFGGPGGAVHSVSVVPNKAGDGFVTVTSDRGTIKSVDAGASTITLVEGTKSATYQTPTITIPSGASVTLDGKSSSLGALAAEDQVTVISSSEGTTVFATDPSFKPEGGPGKWSGGGAPPQGAPPVPSEG